MPVSNQNDDLRASLIKYAGRVLSLRPYFKFKLRDKLFLRAEKLGSTDASKVIDSVLHDLEKSGYLNDRYLAEAYVRRQLAKGYGSKIIHLKMKYLGLDQKTISETLKSEASEEVELQSLEKYSLKFARLDKQKLVHKLYTRGYSSALIRKVIQYNY